MAFQDKTQYLYQKLLEEGNGDQKYLRCPYLWDKKFEVMNSEIALDEINLDCAENVKTKTTGNDSGFITNSNTQSIFGVIF